MTSSRLFLKMGVGCKIWKAAAKTVDHFGFQISVEAKGCSFCKGYMNNSESYSGENLGRCIGELLFTDHPSQEALVLDSSHGMQKGAGLGSNPGQWAQQVCEWTLKWALWDQQHFIQVLPCLQKHQPTAEKPVCPCHLVCQTEKPWTCLLCPSYHPFVWCPQVSGHGLSQTLRTVLVFSQPADREGRGNWALEKGKGK